MKTIRGLDIEVNNQIFDEVLTEVQKKCFCYVSDVFYGNWNEIYDQVKTQVHLPIVSQLHKKFD